MVQFNFAEKQIKAKVVYYGPAQSGKTTNLEQVHVLTDPTGANRLVSLNTSQDRTLFFDLLPFSLGTVSGYDFQVQLYTVPGQVQYNATRRVVLAGAHAVVFVADSRKAMAKENQAAFENMKVNLLANRLVPEKVPLVLQWNKQDLPDLLPEDELNRLMNPWDRAAITAVACEGQGVMDTFSTGVKQMLHASAVKYNLKQKGLDPEQVPEMVEAAFSKLMEAAASAQPIAIMLDDSEDDASPEKAKPKPAKIVLAQSPDASQAGALQASPDAGLVAEELLQRAIKSNIDLAETLADVVKQINAGLGKLAMQAQKLKTLTAEDSQERKAVDALMNEAGSLAEVVQNLGQASKSAGAAAAGLQSHPPIAKPATKPPGVGSGPPKAAPDIGTAMRDAVNKLRPTLEERGVSVDLMVSGASPLNRLSPDAVRKAVGALVDGVSATTANGAKTTLRCEKKPVILRGRNGEQMRRDFWMVAMTHGATLRPEDQQRVLQGSDEGSLGEAWRLVREMGSFVRFAPLATGGQETRLFLPAK